MKYKFLCILLALCLALPLSGCSILNNFKKGVKFELLAEDADLTEAPSVVLEPKEQPYNLGGWTVNNIVSWEVELPQDGQYVFEINYSRPGQYPYAWGILRVETEDGATYDMDFQANPTGKDLDIDDWSVYITHDGLGSVLTAGMAKISIIPNYELDGTMPEHFINLRSITVTSDSE
jgi:hypothetical protein